VRTNKEEWEKREKIISERGKKYKDSIAFFSATIVMLPCKDSEFCI
jgi:hypothetical protein